MALNNEFNILELARISREGTEEKLLFQSGVNLIEGGPNTGKTTWLQCLNYLLGSENPIDHYFSDRFIDKYRSIKGLFKIHSGNIQIERDWTISGEKSKIRLNGELKSSDQFQRDILGKINIPDLEYPKTDPVSEIKATRLSFRMLFRHLYRQQRFWNDLVDRQPSGEFRACVLNFIGIAKEIYTPEYYKYFKVSDQLKEANFSYQSYKDTFQNLLSFVSREDKSEDIDMDLLRFKSFFKSEVENLSELYKLLEIEKIKIIEARRTDSLDALHYFKIFEEYIILQKKITSAEDRMELYKNIMPYVESIKRASLIAKERSEEVRLYYKYIEQLKNSVNINYRLETLCESMEEYLQALNTHKASTWKHRMVSMTVHRNFINVQLGVRSWNTVLGGTDSLYFFLAYHYGLLSICCKDETSIPSLAIIDFPPDIQGEEISNNLSLTVKPFIDLLKQHGHSHCQIIFAGHTFESLTGVHLIKMVNEYVD
jgi:hypothetical protein